MTYLIYLLRATATCACLFALSLAYASAQSVSFKDFYPGMSVQEVDSILTVTGWQDAYGKDSAADYRILNAKTGHEDLLEIYEYEQGGAHFVDKIEFIFLSIGFDSVYSISAFGEAFEPKYFTLLGEWIGHTFATLQQKYGSSTYISKKLDKDAEKAYTTGKSVVIARWDIKKNKKQKKPDYRIEVSIVPDKEGKLSGHIGFELVGLKERAEIEAERQANEALKIKNARSKF